MSVVWKTRTRIQRELTFQFSKCFLYYLLMKWMIAFSSHVVVTEINCLFDRSLKFIQTRWSVLHTWRVLVEGCGWHSQKVPPFVSFILKRWNFCRKSTSQHAQRSRTLVHACLIFWGLSLLHDMMLSSRMQRNILLLWFLALTRLTW